MERLESRKKLPIMAHLVMGFPTLAESLRSAETYIRAGVQVLELQIPFSHPTADGPVITAACRAAVQQGVTVQHCIEAVRDLRRRFPAQEIMVMSYLNRIYSYGFQKFADEMSALEIRHLIIPDLPVTSLAAGRLTRPGLQLVPVLAANISDARLEKLLDAGFNFFYLMSDFKITGSSFSLHPRLKEVIARIRETGASGVARSLPRVGIGFGISTPEQARLVVEEADLAIIGSALIQAQQDNQLETYLETLRNHLPPLASQKGVDFEAGRGFQTVS